MTEIERKFSVIPEVWETLEKPEPVFIAQGYLQHDAEKTIRVRIKGSQGYLTLKSAGNGISREEWEYPIPASDARELLERFAPQRIEKFRYRIAASHGLTWEVDVFIGANEGLLLAEIELPAEDYPFEKPDWLGKERTGQHAYYNVWLAEHPYSTWSL
jgi:adenylate cyclase